RRGRRSRLWRRRRRLRGPCGRLWRSDCAARSRGRCDCLFAGHGPIDCQPVVARRFEGDSWNCRQGEFLLALLLARSLAARSEVLVPLPVDVLLAIVALQLTEDHVELAALVKDPPCIDGRVSDRTANTTRAAADRAES